MIPFNKAPLAGNEEQYVLEAIRSGKICGDGVFTKKCHQWFENKLQCQKALLTTSCTHALEMCAILLEIKEGDEVIMPSYTFVSTANAFVLRGAKIVFVDVRPDTMNIDETQIESAITPKTKAIVPVHYAGVACEMDTIMAIADKHNLFVVEDAAQGMMCTYKGKPLGTIGHLGAYSFHETKNYTSAGEGGLLIVNDKRFSDRAEIIREKGTNRSQFFRGAVDKYSWVDMGSSYLPSDVNASYLCAQLECVDKINDFRLSIWNRYYKGLENLAQSGYITLPQVPTECIHNAHIFYFKVKDLETRTSLINYLKEQQISAVFHYVPLHSTATGQKYGSFHNQDIYTTKDSDRLLRLPMYYGLDDTSVSQVIDAVQSFFTKAN